MLKAEEIGMKSRPLNFIEYRAQALSLLWVDLLHEPHTPHQGAYRSWDEIPDFGFVVKLNAIIQDNNTLG